MVLSPHAVGLLDALTIAGSDRPPRALLSLYQHRCPLAGADEEVLDDGRRPNSCTGRGRREEG